MFRIFFYHFFFSACADLKQIKRRISSEGMKWLGFVVVVVCFERVGKFFFFVFFLREKFHCLLMTLCCGLHVPDQRKMQKEFTKFFTKIDKDSKQ